MSSGHDHHDHDHGHGPDHDHDHDHGHSHGLGHHHHGGQGPKALTRAIAITAFFMIVEIIGGYLANSLALLGDAAHMLIDIGAMLMSLFVIWVSRRPVTSKMSFGYHRAEILGALASGLLIWGIAGALVFEAIHRLQSPPEVKGPLLFVVAVIGLLANLGSMWMLHHASSESLNVRAAYLHVLSDMLGSVGAIVAGAVLWATNWAPIDPIITIIFAALMLWSSWHLIRDAVVILMESTPKGLDSLAVKAALAELPGVREVHDLHIWTVASGRPALSVHLVAQGSSSALLQAANALLEERYGIIHTTIQIENPEKFSSERCYDCTATVEHDEKE